MMGLNNISLTFEPKIRTPKIISTLMAFSKSICPGDLGPRNKSKCT